jgi:hypothetical protein
VGQAGADEPVSISSARQTSVVDSLSILLENLYVYPEHGTEMARLLHRKLNRSEYEGLADPHDFAQALTETMHEVVTDEHLWIRFGPGVVARMHEAEADTADSARLAQDDLAAARARNFGFRKVEMLTGNIGYLKFNGFSGLAEATETAKAALAFLCNADALIIDLIENGGGSKDMIRYISSYLIEGEEHLNSFYDRIEDTIITTSTYPHIQGQRLSEIPVYILTGRSTFSAAEGFAYVLKHRGRATIVGDTTRGGAHPVNQFAVDEGFVANIPFARAINPITGTNWEGVGVVPEIVVPEEQALDAARLDAMKTIVESSANEDQAATLRFFIAGLESLFNPVALTISEMEPYVGSYGPRMVSLEDGELFYQREGNPRYRMIPMGDDLFRFTELDYFHLGFERDATGAITAAIGNYPGGYTDRNPRDTEP